MRSLTLRIATLVFVEGHGGHGGSGWRRTSELDVRDIELKSSSEVGERSSQVGDGGERRVIVNSSCFSPPREQCKPKYMKGKRAGRGGGGGG